MLTQGAQGYSRYGRNITRLARPHRRQASERPIARQLPKYIKANGRIPELGDASTYACGLLPGCITGFSRE